MEKEFTAKTVEEAKRLAAIEFGVSVDDIDFDILEQPRKTLFGGFKGEARVNAIYEPVVEKKERIYQASEEDLEEDARAEAMRLSAAEEDDASYSQDSDIEPLPEDFDVNKSVKVQTAIGYLTDVLKALGMAGFTITPYKRGGMVVLDISGEKLGIVIGKRGETLDSLQYLTILASNRSEESFCRISLDCNGYREKRHEALISLAKKTSSKVIKQGRKIALEPMNPYERRIIHSCVAEIEGVSSRSTGSEPYRKVVIYADKPKYDSRRRGEGRGKGGRGGYRRSNGNPSGVERDYKRPSYDSDTAENAVEFSKETVDAEKNAKLYGKIEL